MMDVVITVGAALAANERGTPVRGQSPLYGDLFETIGLAGNRSNT